MSEIALSLNDVHVVYTRSRQVVLQGFSMSVHKGELVCLLGVSGCGKTTVLRTVAGSNDYNKVKYSYHNAV